MRRVVDEAAQEPEGVTLVERDRTDRLGVQWMSEIKSREGIPLQKGRSYELIADYDNTTNAPIDAMAIIYLYAIDVPPTGK